MTATKNKPAQRNEYRRQIASAQSQEMTARAAKARFNRFDALGKTLFHSVKSFHSVTTTREILPTVTSSKVKRATNRTPAATNAPSSLSRSNCVSFRADANSSMPHSVIPATRPQSSMLLIGSGDHETATSDQAARAAMNRIGTRGSVARMPARFRPSDSNANDVATRRTTSACGEKTTTIGKRTIAAANIRIEAPTAAGCRAPRAARRAPHGLACREPFMRQFLR